MPREPFCLECDREQGDGHRPDCQFTGGEGWVEENEVPPDDDEESDK